MPAQANTLAVLRLHYLRWILLLAVLTSCSTPPTDQPLRNLVSELAPGSRLLDPPRASSVLGRDGLNQVLVDNAGEPVPSFATRTLSYASANAFNGDFSWLSVLTANLSGTEQANGTATLTNISVRELTNPQPDIDSAVFRAAVGSFDLAHEFDLGPICCRELACADVVFSGFGASSTRADVLGAIRQLGFNATADASSIRAGSGAGKNLVLAQENAKLRVVCRPVADRYGGATLDLGDGYTAQVTEVNLQAQETQAQYKLRVSRIGGQETESEGRFGFTSHVITSNRGTITALRVNWAGHNTFQYRKTEFLCKWLR